MTPDETREHVRRRLSELGWNVHIGRAGYEKIFRATGGAENETNRICHRLISAGSAGDRRDITDELVEIAVTDLSHKEERPSHPRTNGYEEADRASIERLAAVLDAKMKTAGEPVSDAGVPPRRDAAPGARAGSEPGTLPKVLVVQTSDAEREATVRALSRDCRLVEATDGEAAWHVLRGQPDVEAVLVERAFADANGRSLVRRMRAETGTPHLAVLPVIVLGAPDDAAARLAAAKSGANDFVPVTADPRELRARVMAQVKARRKPVRSVRGTAAPPVSRRPADVLIAEPRYLPSSRRRPARRFRSTMAITLGATILLVLALAASFYVSRNPEWFGLRGSRTAAAAPEAVVGATEAQPPASEARQAPNREAEGPQDAEQAAREPPAAAPREPESATEQATPKPDPRAAPGPDREADAEPPAQEFPGTDRSSGAGGAAQAVPPAGASDATSQAPASADPAPPRTARSPAPARSDSQTEQKNAPLAVAPPAEEPGADTLALWESVERDASRMAGEGDGAAPTPEAPAPKSERLPQERAGVQQEAIDPRASLPSDESTRVLREPSGREPLESRPPVTGDERTLASQQPSVREPVEPQATDGERAPTSAPSASADTRAGNARAPSATAPSPPRAGPERRPVETARAARAPRESARVAREPSVSTPAARASEPPERAAPPAPAPPNASVAEPAPASPAPRTDLAVAKPPPGAKARSQPADQISRDELVSLVQRFASVYEAGDLEQFLGLFAENARTNDRAGRDGIRRDYESLFGSTDMRRMKLSELSWEVNGNQAYGWGEFDVTVRRQEDRAQFDYTGSLTFVVEKVDGRLRITRLFHGQQRVSR